jgi:hypothetical protein
VEGGAQQRFADPLAPKLRSDADVLDESRSPAEREADELRVLHSAEAEAGVELRVVAGRGPPCIEIGRNAAKTVLVTVAQQRVRPGSDSGAERLKTDSHRPMSLADRQA